MWALSPQANEPLQAEQCFVLRQSSVVLFDRRSKGAMDGAQKEQKSCHGWQPRVFEGANAEGRGWPFLTSGGTVSRLVRVNSAARPWMAGATLYEPWMASSLLVKGQHYQVGQTLKTRLNKAAAFDATDQRGRDARAIARLPGHAAGDDCSPGA